MFPSFYKVTVFFFLFTSCANDPRLIEPFLDIEEPPSEIMHEVELLYTEYGKIRVKVIAEKIVKYDASSPLIHFFDGVNVFFYNDSSNIVSTLTSKEAIIDNKQQKMEVFTNVVLTNNRNEKLNTEQLIWDETRELIFTNQSVEITTKDEIIFGKGFQSSVDFTSYKINNVQGSIKILSDKESL